VRPCAVAAYVVTRVCVCAGRVVFSGADRPQHSRPTKITNQQNALAPKKQNTRLVTCRPPKQQHTPKKKTGAKTRRKNAATDLVETFSRVHGVYLHYADDKPPESVRGWAVQCVALRREERYLDRNAQLEFFRGLDASLAAKGGGGGAGGAGAGAGGRALAF